MISASTAVVTWRRCAAEKASLTKMSPSAAISFARSMSPFSSPLWKRVFSSRMTPAGGRSAIAFFTCSPLQSAMKLTLAPSTFATAPATGARLISAVRSPFGRPKCASRATFAPAVRRLWTVSTAARRRVSSVTRPFSIGTLKSTRTSATLPVRLPASEMRLKEAIILSAHPREGRDLVRLGFVLPGLRFRGDERIVKLEEFRHHERGVAHARGEAPLVVIPGQDRHEVAVHHLGLVEMEDRRAVVMDEVGRDVRLVGDAEHALQRAVAGCRDDGVVHFLNRRGFLGDEFQVDNRHVRRRHAHRDAV